MAPTTLLLGLQARSSNKRVGLKINVRNVVEVSGSDTLILVRLIRLSCTSVTHSTKSGYDQ